MALGQFSEGCDPRIVYHGGPGAKLCGQCNSDAHLHFDSNPSCNPPVQQDPAAVGKVMPSCTAVPQSSYSERLPGVVPQSSYSEQLLRVAT